ncbi:MAG: hypothetical protein K8F30_13670 [Taibaiella sp.]|nr:hypothetical protein [Taibaiella sp.]
MNNKWIYTGIVYIISLGLLGYALALAEKDSWQYWGAIILAVIALGIYFYRRNKYLKANRVGVSRKSK